MFEKMEVIITLKGRGQSNGSITDITEFLDEHNIDELYKHIYEIFPEQIRNILTKK